MGLQKKVLDNGVTVLYQSVAGVGSIYIGLAVAVGSRDEPPELRGISHMFEHIIFKGSRKYPDQLTFARAVEPHASDFNASTGDYSTCFHATIAKDSLDQVLAALSDAVINPLFNNKEFKKERLVVLNELRDALDDPEESTEKEFYRIVLGGTPIAHPTIGTEETLLDMVNWDLKRFHKEHYHAGNLALVVTGDFKVRTLMALVKKYLGDLPDMEPSERAYKRLGMYRPKTIALHRGLKQAHVHFGRPIRPHLTPAESMMWDIFTDMLGDGISSLLFDEVRIKHGLVYNIEAEYADDPDMGCVQIKFSCKPEDVPKVLVICRRVIAEALSNRKRFNETKRRKLSKLTIDKDDAAVVFENAINLWPKTREAYSQRQEKQLVLMTTLADIRREVLPYLDFSEWTTVLVGP